MTPGIDEEIIDKYDRSGMVEMVLSIPGQMREGWREAGKLSLGPPPAGGELIVCGMGGSAIGAALAKDLSGYGSSFHFHIERGYTLPGFADSDSTVICISYSGNTEEILALFEEARRRGCGLGVITSGGELARRAEQAEVPAVKVRGGLPPRAAIGYLFVPLLKLLSVWGAVEMAESDFSRLVGTVEAALKSISPSAADNPAAEISGKLSGKIPLIYSGGALLRAAAYRWKCQFNENSKMMAFSNVFPELGHNEVMGWDCPGDISEKMAVIVLTDRDDHPRVVRRMEITSSMMEDMNVEVIRIDSGNWFPEGASTAGERLLSTVVLGDMTSVYLALRRNLDPVPIERIDLVKKKLRME